MNTISDINYLFGDWLNKLLILKLKLLSICQNLDLNKFNYLKVKNSLFIDLKFFSIVITTIRTNIIEVLLVYHILNKKLLLEFS